MRECSEQGESDFTVEKDITKTKKKKNTEKRNVYVKTGF